MAKRLTECFLVHVPTHPKDAPLTKREARNSIARATKSRKLTMPLGPRSAIGDGRRNPR